jgi:hypothetical protein
VWPAARHAFTHSSPFSELASVASTFLDLSEVTFI